MPFASFDLESVEDFTRRFEELFYANDAAAMTAPYSEDGQIMAEGLTPVRGHTEIARFWQHAMDSARAAGARRTIQLHEATSSGDLGYALCTVTVEVPNATAPTAPIKITSWGTTVWRREGDGQWRIVVDISAHLPTARA
jgi:ketosteroid isomerase-like protein